MSMVEVSEEGKQLAVPDTNKLDTWKHIEDKTISDLLCSTQVLPLKFFINYSLICLLMFLIILIGLYFNMF